MTNFDRMKSVALVISFFVASCAPSLRPIAMKGDYTDIARHTKTAKSFDEILASVKTTLDAEGIAIKEYSKETGEIITAPAKVPFTTEDGKGNLKDTTAYIVCALQYNHGAQKTVPIFGDITAEWHISVIKDGDSNTVFIKPMHVANYLQQGNKKTSRPMPAYHTTGLFESNLLAKI
jgi:hypothetical protein